MTDDKTLLEQIRTEREALQADMARRREQLDREEVLAEARKSPVTKSGPPPRDYGRQRSAPPSPPPPTSSSITRQWVTREINRRERAAQRAVAEVMIEEEKARIAEIAALRERVMALENELRAIGQERGARLRSVPTTPSALIA